MGVCAISSGGRSPSGGTISSIGDAWAVSSGDLMGLLGSGEVYAISSSGTSALKQPTAAQQTGGKHPGIVHNQAVPRPQQRGQVIKMPVAPPASILVQRASSGSGDGITITGTGWGHGVGMSQYGAKAMAEQGYTYEASVDGKAHALGIQRPAAGLLGQRHRLPSGIPEGHRRHISRRGGLRHVGRVASITPARLPTKPLRRRRGSWPATAGNTRKPRKDPPSPPDRAAD